jgi:hypothetical protein
VGKGAVFAPAAHGWRSIQVSRPWRGEEYLAHLPRALTRSLFSIGHCSGGIWKLIVENNVQKRAMDLQPPIVGSILCSILARQVWCRNETIVFGFPGGPDRLRIRVEEGSPMKRRQNQMLDCEC